MTTDQKPWRAKMPKAYNVPPPWTEGVCDSESVWHLVVDANDNADRLRSELDAARVRIAELEAAQQWRPMETAPTGRDPRTGLGWAVLLLHTADGPYAVTRAQWSAYGWHTDDGWTLKADSAACGWLPMPEPPKEGS